MLYFIKLLFLLINIEQETVLSWFGIQYSDKQEIQQILENHDSSSIAVSNFESSSAISIKTFQLIIEGLWGKVQSGLSLADIENVLIFILFIRFVILAIRYNLKTSFYITCIGIFAGYLWYRHFVDLVDTYQNFMVYIPFVNKLGMNGFDMDMMDDGEMIENMALREKVHWYNPGQLLYYAFTQGITHVDNDSGNRSYIDPISMIVSNLNEPNKSTILPIYYKIYNKIIPKIYDIVSKFWMQTSAVAAYAVVTRIGKRYCPYLVRWHWTFLLMTTILEDVMQSFLYRMFYYQAFVLTPKLDAIEAGYGGHSENLLDLQIKIAMFATAIVMIAHLGLILLALLHALCGQYFYVPFLVENTELHIGPRPKDSVYSGGYTSWQDKDIKEKNVKRFIPKLWYGWFGKGDKWNIIDNIFLLIKIIMQFIQKLFRKIQRKLKK